MNWDELFKRFVKEKKFLQNVTDKTCYWYEFSWASYKRMTGGEEIDRFRLNEYMVKLRESGVSAASANTYARAINSFLTWLWENNQLGGERLRIKKLKEEQKVIPTYTTT